MESARHKFSSKKIYWETLLSSKTVYLNIFRSYFYPRVSGNLAKQTKCEDPIQQRDPVGSNFYKIDSAEVTAVLGSCVGKKSPICSVDAQKITPVSTFYPPATVCYVDESGGRRLEYLIMTKAII